MSMKKYYDAARPLGRMKSEEARGKTRSVTIISREMTDLDG